MLSVSEFVCTATRVRLHTVRCTGVYGSGAQSPDPLVATARIDRIDVGSVSVVEVAADGLVRPKLDLHICGDQRVLVSGVASC